ncbi:hypothetical protein E2562_019888 [Oryza meyeriana var. granulata]|uniref:26S proteasome non-ATPase regulatory subunit 4 homolog n=1 Tax=Oryza meyeriana var. granulata TaxID=110450 RepID=A0A6G1EXH1_9ORYZ|nr:hypothetical protein E2562_019888 [Oryza meyeriana var. granulata]
MVLEATMICVDDSEWMRNGDYPPTRLLAQPDAVNLVFVPKTENMVGVLAMAGDGVRMLFAPTGDPMKFLAYMDACLGLKESGEANLTAAIQVAQLALKNCPKKNQLQRIVVFVGSPVKDEKNVLEAIGKTLKKNNVSLDVVDFGESDDEKPEKLEALVAAVNVGGNSHIVHIPPGEDALHDVLAKTPIITGDEGGGAAAGGASRFEYGVDPNVDPELALALHLSAEEERERQEAAAKKATKEPSKAENKCESSTSNTDTLMAELESESDTYVPFLDWVKTDPFATGAEPASDTAAEDERVTDDEARLLRLVLQMSDTNSRAANEADAEMSDDSLSERERQLVLQTIGETGSQSEGKDVFELLLHLDLNDPLIKNMLSRTEALRGQGEQEEEVVGDEQEEEEGGDEAEEDE